MSSENRRKKGDARMLADPNGTGKGSSQGRSRMPETKRVDCMVRKVKNINNECS